VIVNGLRVLKGAAVFQVGGDANRPEGMTTGGIGQGGSLGTAVSISMVWHFIVRSHYCVGRYVGLWTKLNCHFRFTDRRLEPELNAIHETKATD
jgi:hypothetical protein